MTTLKWMMCSVLVLVGVSPTAGQHDQREAQTREAQSIDEALHKQGYYTDAQLRSVYAGGILRVLQNNRPRRDQPYNTMQLMQWNFYLENGLLSFDPATKTLRINYDKYHDVVGKMLEQTLAVQYEGDKAASDKFIDQYTKWDENLHGAVTRVPVDATAVPHREEGYNLLITSVWADPAASDENVAWTRTAFEALRPYAAGRRYSNYLAADETDEGPVRQAYGPNYDRLAAVKRAYDPENLFRLNQNVRPASGAAS